MRSTVSILAFAAFALAAPAVEMQKRQMEEDDFINGPCRDIILFFARGTFEVGNMGLLVGPPLSKGLKLAFGDLQVASQGVDYAAGVATNLLPNNADPVGVANMMLLFNEASAKCPDSIVVASGYSQGAAITHAAIEGIPAAVKSQIAGVVTFGDTRTLQDDDHIPGYPTEDLLIICNPGDLVCNGTLVIDAEHLEYGARVPEAVSFLTTRIRAAGK